MTCGHAIGLVPWGILHLQHGNLTHEPLGHKSHVIIDLQETKNERILPAPIQNDTEDLDLQLVSRRMKKEVQQMKDQPDTRTTFKHH